MTKHIFEGPLLILALLIYIILSVLVLTLVLFSILEMLLLGLLTLLGLLLVVVAAPHRCRPAHTAIVGELLVSLSHVNRILRVLSDLNDLSDHTILDDVLDELELVRYRGRGEDVTLHKGVGYNLVVLVELRKVQ